MYKLQNKEQLLPFSELEKYDNEEWFCCGIIFDPDEDYHWNGCPPYMCIANVEKTDVDVYIEIPAIMAYYAKKHAGYTNTGRKQIEEQGKHKLRQELKDILDID